MKKTVLLLAMLPLMLFAETVDVVPDAKKWGGWDSNCSISGNEITIVSKEKGKTIAMTLSPEKFAGKRVTLSAEVKRSIPEVFVKWQGGKLMFTYQTSTKAWNWPGAYMEPGEFGWQKISIVHDMPGNIEKLSITLGIQGGKGSISYRNIKVEIADSVLDLSSAANMGYADPKAGDGVGGWSDQGPNNDAAAFRFKEKLFGGVPFHAIDPKDNNGKSVLTFRSPRFGKGIEKAEINLEKQNVSGKYFYLLHTLTWGSGTKSVVGYVDLHAENGKTMTVPVTGCVDVGDWWNASRVPNGFPTASWKNAAGGIVSVYVSKFQLDSTLGKLKKVVFRTADSEAIWIVLGATVSEQEYQFPKTEKIVIKESAEWKKKATGKQVVGVISGSILDLTDVLPVQSVEKTGRVMVGADGRFFFEKAPTRPARFMTNTILLAPFYGHNKAPKEFTDKQAIMEYCREMRRQGYNMIRFHFLDDTFMGRAAKDFEFKKDTIDTFDYLIYCMKENGIYANIDAMARRIGYEQGYTWDQKPGDNRAYKRDIFFSEHARANWEKGFLQVLNHVNPYTGKALKDDPVLALIVCFNEQPFAWTMNDLSMARTEWQRFLKEKYKTIAALEKAWGIKVGVTDFKELPTFTAGEINSSSKKGIDLVFFVATKEQELTKWYLETIRKTGTKALVTNSNLGFSPLYMDSRRNADYIALNTYKAHPFGNICDPIGSIEETAKLARMISTVQEYGKPLVVTEHAHAYWNKYRYEQAFVTGAYAALQDMGGLSGFAGPISVKSNSELPADTFGFLNDPIMRSSELLSMFMFLRGDVATAGHTVRLEVDPMRMIADGKGQDSVDVSQNSLALISKLRVDLNGGKNMRPNEITFPMCAGSSVITRSEGYQMVVDKFGNEFFDTDKVIAEMKQKRFINSKNRSNFRAGIFESETGELYLDSKRSFMSVDTPRMQGVCAKAGSTAKLSGIQINKMSTEGNLVAVARDGVQPLKTAKRILVVYATNAYNTGTTFGDSAFRTRLDNGKLPILVRTGAFSMTVQNKNASSMKAWAVGFDGSRICELPLKKDGESFTLEVDTAKQAEGVYFFEMNNN